MKNKKTEKVKTSQSKKNLDFKKTLSSKLILIILILIFSVLFLIIKVIKTEGKKTIIQKQILPKAIKKLIQNDKANFEIKNFKEVSGLYQFQLVFKDQYNRTYTSYITKDGKILFTSGIILDDIFKAQKNTINQQKKLSCSDLKKNSNPKLVAFIMANCPYGLQIQRVFKNAINTDKNLLKNLRVEYIFNQDSNFETGDLTSLHGKDEAQENLRQICIREEQPSLYWSYVSCYMQKENNSENCLTQMGVNIQSLNTCMTDKNRGLKYAKADFENTKKLGISGSPTLVLNGSQIVSEFDFGGRNPNAIKEILCCSADKKLAYCNKEFSKKDAAVSFSQTDEQVAGTSSSGGCN